MLDAHTAIASPCVENWVAEGLSGWVCGCWGRILGAHSRPCFEVVEWSSTLAFVFECTTRLLSEPRMHDQSVGRFVPFAGQSFSVMVLSGGGGDLLDIRREGGERHARRVGGRSLLLLSKPQTRGESAKLTCQVSGWAVGVVEMADECGWMSWLRTWTWRSGRCRRLWWFEYVGGDICSGVMLGVIVHGPMYPMWSHPQCGR